MTCALLMLLTFLGACLCLWKWWVREGVERERQYLKQLPEIRAREQERAWRVGKLVLSLEAGVDSGAEVLLRPDLKQAVDTYFVKPHLGTASYGTASYDKSLWDLLDALRTLGLIEHTRSEDARWVKAYYDLKWNEHPAIVGPLVSIVDYERWQGFDHNKIKPYIDRVIEQPEPTNKAENEAKEYVELALRLGTYETRQSDYWVQRVTGDKAEQRDACGYGLCLYALRKGWVSKEICSKP